MAHEPTLQLPTLVVGIADVMRLRRELEALYDFLHQAALRHTAETELKLPKTSRMLDELTRLNGINLLKRDEYEATMAALEAAQSSAPQVHLAFSTDPSAAFVAKIVEWLRANIHPALLVQVGIQPNLAAGCVLRTTNKQFDMSLKQHFAKARPTLIEELEAGVAA